LWTRVTPLGTGPRPPAGAPQEAPAARAHPMLEVLAVHDGSAGPMQAEHQPVASAAPNLAPYLDHSPGAGSMCWVTGQGIDSTQVDQADVDGGKTSLTTPALDMTGMTQPTIGYWRWFASWQVAGLHTGSDGPDPSDYLAVLISDDDG